MSKLLNPIAEKDYPDSGEILSPSEASLIRQRTKLFCPDHDCLDPNRNLILVKRNIHFFRHKANFEHEIHPQTLLHKLAIKWFENKESFEVPQYGTIFQRQIVVLAADQTQLEYRKLERIIPDVKLKIKDGFEFAIEIFVTSNINEEKRKLIDQFGLPTIRIDLSDFYDNNSESCRTDFDFVKDNLDSLLTDISLKSWVTPIDVDDIKNMPKVIEKQLSKNIDNNGCLLVIGALAVFIIFRGFIFLKNLFNKNL